MKRTAAVASLLVLLFAASSRLQSSPAAHAEIDGPCEATVRGIDVSDLSSSDAGDAIEVEGDAVLTVEMTSATGADFVSHKVNLEIAGVSISIEDDPEDSDPEWSETVNVDDYSFFGVGLYKVSGSATLSDGTTCSGAVLIQIKGFPLTTIAGIAALIVGAIGLVLIGLSALSSLREFGRMRDQVNAWAAEQAQRISGGLDVSQEELAAGLRAITGQRGFVGLTVLALMPLMLMTAAIGGGGGAAAIGALRLPRIGFRPRLSILGAIGGSLLGESITAFLGFFAISPITGSNVIVAAVLGILLGVLVDAVIRWIGSRDVNKAIANAEKQLAELKERQRRQRGEQPAG